MSTTETPALFRLISLQNADGSWSLSPVLAAVLSLSEDTLKQEKPQQSTDDSLWVTVLAVIWLHAMSFDQKDEWELLEGKAVSWIKSKAGSSLSELVNAGNKLLNSKVDLKVFGL
ncbi:von Willebrand factor A domain-containing protein 5A-like [Pelobates fuscus]|uniref:von Willebrand factor A domain-containing protein 5A-like n=1 Tax=Pelobates fuscus TaxID=191477 RepID=UPI002FE4D2AA